MLEPKLLNLPVAIRSRGVGTLEATCRLQQPLKSHWSCSAEHWSLATIVQGGETLTGQLAVEFSHLNQLWNALKRWRTALKVHAGKKVWDMDEKNAPPFIEDLQDGTTNKHQQQQCLG